MTSSASFAAGGAGGTSVTSETSFLSQSGAVSGLAGTFSDGLFAIKPEAPTGAAASFGGIVVGCRHRAKNRAQQMPSIDAGQPASFEAWVDQASGLARVRYRGASWEARLEGQPALQSGAVVYVLAAEGNTLRVSATRPA